VPAWDSVVKRKIGELDLFEVAHFRPATGEVSREVGRLEGGYLATLPGIGGGRLGQVRADVLLKMAAEVDGATENPLRAAHRIDSIGIDQLQTDRDLLSGRRMHLGEKETGKVIADNNAGFGGEGGDRSPARIRRWLEVGIVPCRSVAQSRSVVLHPVDDELVKSGTIPAIVRTERFKNQQRLGQFLCPVESPVKAVIPTRPPIGDHPVEHILAARINLSVVRQSNAGCGNAGFHCRPQWSQGNEQVRRTAPFYRFPIDAITARHQIDLDLPAACAEGQSKKGRPPLSGDLP